MNIAIISLYLPSISKMGVGYQVHGLANGLARRGHHVTVFGPCPRPGDALYDVEQFDAPRPMRSLRLSWKLRAVDWSRFDVIHAHGEDWFLWNTPVPHVRTIHGSCLAEAIHIPGLRAKVHMLWLALLETISVAAADRTIGVSMNTLASYPWIAEMIPNGVDLQTFRPGEKDSTPAILFVGTYRNRKRGKMLMEIFAREIRPRIPDCRLWMVCSDAPAAEGVTVFGSLPTEKLADLYRRAWVFCLPSSYEGFGVPYVEAMASGTAVVATPNLGAREVLSDGRFGIIAQPGELGAALVRLLTDAGQRARLAGAGMRRARDFDWPRVLDQYERVYSDLLGCNANSWPPPLPSPATRNAE